MPALTVVATKMAKKEITERNGESTDSPLRSRLLYSRPLMQKALTAISTLICAPLHSRMNDSADVVKSQKVAPQGLWLVMSVCPVKH